MGQPQKVTAEAREKLISTQARQLLLLRQVLDEVLSHLDHCNNSECNEFAIEVRARLGQPEYA